jgi:hypothetical protein
MSGCGGVLLGPRGATPQLAALYSVLLLHDGPDDLAVVGADGESWARVSLNVNADSSPGGQRALSITPDGKRLWTCGYLGLRCYDARGELCALVNRACLAVFALNTEVFTLTSAGSICGDSLVVYDNNGAPQRGAAIAGHDLVVDDDTGTVWVVGCQITKCDRELNVEWSIDPLTWVSTGVDSG